MFGQLQTDTRSSHDCPERGTAVNYKRNIVSYIWYFVGLFVSGKYVIWFWCYSHGI